VEGIMNGNDWAKILYEDPQREQEGFDWKTFTGEDWGRIFQKANVKDPYALGGREQYLPINVSFPEDRRDLATEIEKILNSKDYMMLDPEGRAKVLKVLQSIQLEKEKPVAGVSKVTPTKAVTAKKEPAKREEPRGVQLRMVDGEIIKERAGKWEEELTPEQKIAKRKAELEIDEYYRQLAVKRERPEMFVPLKEREFEYKKAAEKRELEYKEATETREFAAEQAKELREQFEWEEEKRIERDKLFEEKRVWTAEFGADEATRMFDEKMRLFEFRKDVKDTDKQYELDVEKFGEEKAENIRKYNLDTIAEEHSWKELLYQRGFKNEEFVETSKQFWGTLDFNKVKEEARIREAGLTYELDVRKEAGIMERFDDTLKKEYAQLDLDIEKLGLNVETEERIRTLALMNVALKTEQLGLDQAIQRFEKSEAERKEWWNKKDYELKDENANRLLKETEARIIKDAKKTNLEAAVHKENIRQFDEEMVLDYAKLAQKSIDEDTLAVQISPSLSVTLGNMSSEMQADVTRMIGTVYDEKKGFYHPKPEEMEKITSFLFGREGDPRPKERFGVNLDVDEFIRGCAGQFDWSDQMKGWCIITRDKEYMWKKVIARGTEIGSYISPDIEETIKKRGWFETGLSVAVRKAGEKVKGWFGWGEEEAPAVTDFESIKTEVDALYDRTGSMADVERFLTERGMTLDEYREQLRQRG